MADPQGVSERNDYYAFGSRWDAAGSAVSDNRYRYNGKELQTTGGLNYLDYGARMYDARIGRWRSQEPLAEKYYQYGLYNFCLNNPVKCIDKDGRDPGDFFKTIKAAALDWGNYYNGASISRGNEFGSTIYKINVDGKTGYTYSVANEGSGGRVERSNPPNGEDREAIIHSHGNYSPIEYPKSNEFSDKDKRNSYDLKVDSYVATPNGSLLRYDPYEAKTETVSTTLPSDPKDPDRKNNRTPVDIPKEREYQKENTPEKKKEEYKNSFYLMMIR